MCSVGPSWSSTNDYDGRLSVKDEVILGLTKKVFTWRNIDGGAKTCQWFGLASNSYAGNDFRCEFIPYLSILHLNHKVTMINKCISIYTKDTNT